MTAFRRWQDWVVVIAGIALLAAPYIFGETGNSNALWTTGIIGVAMAVVGFMAASTGRANGMEFLPAIAGLAAFLAPWVVPYTDLTATAWVSWIVGAVAVVAAGEVTLESHSFQGA